MARWVDSSSRPTVTRLREKTGVANRSCPQPVGAVPGHRVKLRAQIPSQVAVYQMEGTTSDSTGAHPVRDHRTIAAENPASCGSVRQEAVDFEFFQYG